LVVPEKICTPLTEEISEVEGGFVSDNSTSEGDRRANFLCGGAMDSFWNDPVIYLYLII
jgi:hypothetical protein